MYAFTNTQMTKPQLLRRLRAHAKADEIVKGRYWGDGRGCAVGCSIHGSDHATYEPMFGIPRQIAYLEDFLFENLPNGESKKWPLQFANAIPVGADLSLVMPKFYVWLLTDPKQGVVRFTKDFPDCTSAIERVAQLHRDLVCGTVHKQEDWDAARDAASAAAWSAARDAASAAAWAAPRDAAWDAAGAAARAAAWAAPRDAPWDAAWAAARAAAWDAARDAARAAARDAARDAAWAAAVIAQRDKLLELLSEAQPKTGE